MSDDLPAEIAALHATLERFEHRLLARFERRLLIRVSAVSRRCTFGRPTGHR
jgi:hypothetical protein